MKESATKWERVGKKRRKGEDRLVGSEGKMFQNVTASTHARQYE